MPLEHGVSLNDVLGMVLRQSLILTAAGLAIGLVATLALTRVMAHFISEIGATPVSMISAVMLLLAGATLAATWIPARRAARVDPMLVLRAGE